MGLKDRVKRALRLTEEHTNTLVMPDGEVLHYTDEDWSEALGCVTHREPHWLVDAARRADVWEGPLGMLTAYAVSCERAAEGEEDEEPRH